MAASSDGIGWQTTPAFAEDLSPPPAQRRRGPATVVSTVGGGAGGLSQADEDVPMSLVVRSTCIDGISHPSSSSSLSRCSLRKVMTDGDTHAISPPGLQPAPLGETDLLPTATREEECLDQRLRLSSITRGGEARHGRGAFVPCLLVWRHPYESIADGLRSGLAEHT